MAQVMKDIKKKLYELDKTMIELSHATGISYHTMNGYLNGYSAIPHGNYVKISNQLLAWECGKDDNGDAYRNDAVCL